VGATEQKRCNKSSLIIIMVKRLKKRNVEPPPTVFPSPEEIKKHPSRYRITDELRGAESDALFHVRKARHSRERAVRNAASIVKKAYLGKSGDLYHYSGITRNRGPSLSARKNRVYSVQQLRNKADLAHRETNTEMVKRKFKAENITPLTNAALQRFKHVSHTQSMSTGFKDEATLSLVLWLHPVLAKTAALCYFDRRQTARVSHVLGGIFAAHHNKMYGVAANRALELEANQRRRKYYYKRNKKGYKDHLAAYRSAKKNWARVGRNKRDAPSTQEANARAKEDRLAIARDWIARHPRQRQAPALEAGEVPE
jgi:hypothetical protein